MWKQLFRMVSHARACSCWFLIVSYFKYFSGLICDCKYDPFRPAKCHKNNTCTASSPNERIVCYAAITYDTDVGMNKDDMG